MSHTVKPSIKTLKTMIGFLFVYIKKMSYTQNMNVNHSYRIIVLYDLMRYVNHNLWLFVVYDRHFYDKFVGPIKYIFDIDKLLWSKNLDVIVIKSCYF